MDYIKGLFTNPIFTLFAIIAAGMWIGSLKVRGISLGAAGVLAVALVFGHYGAEIPREITDLGLLLFLYAVGLQAGPRFFDLFKRRGMQFLVVGLVSTGVGALVAFGLARYFGLSGPLTAGLYTGATTCTPALAAAMDVIRTKAGPDSQRVIDTVAVGYGLAYPFSVIGVVLFIQLLPALLRQSAQQAAARAREESPDGTEALEKRRFRVTNPNVNGRTVAQIQGRRISEAKISRIKHEGVVTVARPDTVIHLNDLVMAVGTPSELEKIEPVLGEIVTESLRDTTGRVLSEDVVVSREEVTGKPLRHLRAWENLGVVVTRVYREGNEFSPRGSFVLELGDRLRVVGEREGIDSFIHEVGEEERRLDETSLLPFAFGLLLGIAIGLVPIPLPGGLMTRIGMGGGTFIAGLLLGRVGRLGPMTFRVPNAAKYLSRELGLVVFLAGAGVGAGKEFVEILSRFGPQLLLDGAAITIAVTSVAFVLLHTILRWNMLSSAGALSACMTNPPALNASIELAPESDAAALAFASVYPVGLLGKIVWAQVLAMTLALR